MILSVVCKSRHITSADSGFCLHQGDERARLYGDDKKIVGCSVN